MIPDHRWVLKELYVRAPISKRRRTGLQSVATFVNATKDGIESIAVERAQLFIQVRLQEQRKNGILRVV